jgi:bifunctional non-homologous end joining protein LigD
MAKQSSARVASRAVSLSNLDKIMYPEIGFTKGQVIDYYARVARFILPHLRDRPITMKRFPDEIHGEYFYEKNAPSFTPKWVKTYPIPGLQLASCRKFVIWSRASSKLVATLSTPSESSEFRISSVSSLEPHLPTTILGLGNTPRRRLQR